MKNILKEICVNNFDEAFAAFRKGADRLELCTNLAEGGMTPSYGTLILAKRYIDIPIVVMVRPNGNWDFCYEEKDIELMVEDVKMIEKLNFDSIAFSCLTKEKEIDTDCLDRIVKVANKMELVFVNGFDLIADQYKAIDILEEYQFARILTRGGRGTIENSTAINNLVNLTSLQQYIKDKNYKIKLVVGGGVNSSNYEKIANDSGIDEVHGTKILGNLFD